MADEALTAGAVARRLGVAVTTLRTWHQRYGLGPSHHVPGHHRRYTPEDMDRLQVMRRLTAQGVAPAEAAAWARRVPVPIDVTTPLPPPAGVFAARQPDDDGPAGDDSGFPGAEQGSDRAASADGTAASAVIDGPGALPVTTDPDPPHVAERAGPPRAEGGARLLGDHSGPPRPTGRDFPPHGEAGPHRPLDSPPPRAPGLPRVDAVWPDLAGRLSGARDGGGRTIRTGRAGPAARGLARAAVRLDGPALRDILEMTVADRGVVATWEEVIMPVLIGIGERYAATKGFIEVEHLVSRGITEVLGSVARPPSHRSPRVLLAAADEEQHTLPLEALAAALAQAGVPSRLLGARVPPQALSEAATRTGPAAVVLWSQLPSTGYPEQWVTLLTAPHRPLLAAAAGPGWPRDELPEGVTPIGSLAEAVRLVSLAATPADRPH